MRIEGVESLERRGTHRLLTSEGKVVELQIAAIPLAVDVALSKALPAPQPPYMTTMKDGKAVGRELVENDPAFLAKSAEYSRVYTAAVAYHGLRVEPGVEWDTPRGDDRAFYESILREMMDTGFSGEEIIRLANAIRELGGVTAETLDEAAKAFSAGTGS